jgi:hypothetical protein
MRINVTVLKGAEADFIVGEWVDFYLYQQTHYIRKGQIIDGIHRHSLNPVKKTDGSMYPLLSKCGCGRYFQSNPFNFSIREIYEPFNSKTKIA